MTGFFGSGMIVTEFKQDGMIDLGKGQVEDLCEDHILSATVVSDHRGWQPWSHNRTLWA